MMVSNTLRPLGWAAFFLAILARKSKAPADLFLSQIAQSAVEQLTLAPRAVKGSKPLTM
jgi:hypothetical protein